MASESEVWIDEKYNEESKAYVTNYLKMFKPGQVIKMDLNVVRAARIAMAKKTIAENPNNNVKETEVIVKNKYDDYDIPVSVYTPINELRENSPITCYIHGGGWTLGSRPEYHLAMCALAEATKSIWLSIEYRLGPEFKYPIPLQDCESVLDWVIANKKELGTSSDAKLGVAGDSAGGHFSAILTHDYKKHLDFQILIYPCVELGKKYDSYKRFTKDCYMLIPEVLDFFAGNLVSDLDDAKVKKLSPILADDFTNLPKCLIIASELDPLVDETKAYHDKLNANGNSSTYLLVEGAHHGFFNHPVVMKNSFAIAKKSIVEFMSHL